MEKTLTQIHQSLQKLLGLHRQLLDTVRLEREALVDANLKAIQDVTAAKQGLIEAIKFAETERMKHTAELVLLWKKPLRELTLPNIIILIQAQDPPGADQLRSVFNALTILIQRVSDQNKDNQALVERSLEHINQMKKNVLGETVQRADTYTSHGQKSSGSNGARLISKEA